MEQIIVSSSLIKEKSTSIIFYLAIKGMEN